MRFFFLAWLALGLAAQAGHAQENYEIQVYSSPTVLAGVTMTELHSNYTLAGERQTSPDGLLPTHHVLHETVEITHGFTPWLEVGFYFFNSLGNDGRTAYVGSHVRPRVAVPASWGWPLGVSLSLEYGRQKQVFSPNTETLEIRPILDKTLGRFYVALNPTLDRTFRGPDEPRGLVFSPNVKGSYQFGKVLALGLEYYGSLGPVAGFDAYQAQQQQVYVATDLNLDPRWELNAGLGYGLTEGTDRCLLKLIVGRRFGRVPPQPAPLPQAQ